MNKAMTHIAGSTVLLALSLGLVGTVLAQNTDQSPASNTPTDTAAEQTTTENNTVRSIETPIRSEPTTGRTNLDRERSTGTVNEQNSTATERSTAMSLQRMERSETATERQAAIEAKRLELQANQAERQAALQERAQQRIVNLTATVSNRMTVAIDRLDNVMIRLSERIAIMTERGLDTTAAVTELNQARNELSRARDTLTSIDTDVALFVSSENPRANWTQVRTTYATARDALRATHSSIRTTINLLQTTTAISREATENPEAITNPTN